MVATGMLVSSLYWAHSTAAASHGGAPLSPAKCPCHQSRSDWPDTSHNRESTSNAMAVCPQPSGPTYRAAEASSRKMRLHIAQRWRPRCLCARGHPLRWLPSGATPPRKGSQASRHIAVNQNSTDPFVIEGIGDVRSFASIASARPFVCTSLATRVQPLRARRQIPQTLNDDQLPIDDRFAAQSFFIGIELAEAEPQV